MPSSDCALFQFVHAVLVRRHHGNDVIDNRRRILGNTGHRERCIRRNKIKRTEPEQELPSHEATRCRPPENCRFR